jgi:hypothetical protein
MIDFKREDRYVVLKNKDLEATLTKTEREILEALIWKIEKYRLNNKKPHLECVVVEATWKPEYEQAWALIKNRVENTQITTHSAPFTPITADMVKQFENAVPEGHGWWADRDVSTIIEIAVQVYMGVQESPTAIAKDTQEAV